MPPHCYAGKNHNIKVYNKTFTVQIYGKDNNENCTHTRLE